MAASKKPAAGLLLQILIPLCMLLAVLLVLVLVVRPGGAPSPLVVGGILAVCFAWIGASVLWPSRADRRCQECGTEGLTRIDPKSALGLVCQDCGWRDETASGWYMAEEELEALEPMALERRAAKAAARRASMDIGRSSD